MKNIEADQAKHTCDFKHFFFLVFVFFKTNKKHLGKKEPGST